MHAKERSPPGPAPLHQRIPSHPDPTPPRPVLSHLSQPFPSQSNLIPTKHTAPHLTSFNATPSHLSAPHPALPRYVSPYHPALHTAHPPNPPNPIPSHHQPANPHRTQAHPRPTPTPHQLRPNSPQPNPPHPTPQTPFQPQPTSWASSAWVMIVSFSTRCVAFSSLPQSCPTQPMVSPLSVVGSHTHLRCPGLGHCSGLARRRTACAAILVRNSGTLGGRRTMAGTYAS